MLSITALSGASCSPALEASAALVRAGAEPPNQGGNPAPGGLGDTGSKKATRCLPQAHCSLRDFAHTSMSTQQSAIRTSSGLFILGFCAHVGLKA